MIDSNGYVMSADRQVVRIENGLVVDVDKQFAPLHFINGKDFTSWLEGRAIDSHRANSRLLKKVLRLANRDDANTALAVNAVTITDNYWFKTDDESLTWNEVKFNENVFDTLALKGDPDSFNQKPSRTPELTNIGSFEKCWRLLDGKWWMYKSGNNNQIFSELFICNLGKTLGFNMADYEYDDGYVKTKDFTDGRVNFEPICSVMGDNEDYSDNFDYFMTLSKEIAVDYLKMLYLDSVCYNMDRHTNNYGLLRDVEPGKFISLAPKYDIIIALMANGYPSDVSREKDGILRFFFEFLDNNGKAKELFQSLEIPVITKEMIIDCMDNIPVKIDSEFIIDFILNGQRKLKEYIS